jgi:tetratricopeptide (TPR) repeat protein
MLSLSAGCALVFVLGWRHKGAALLTLICVGVLAAFAFIHYIRSSDSLEYQRYSTLVHGEWTRISMWKSALELWKQAPWFGMGPMQFDWWHASVRGNIPARAVFVHNDYLQLLADYGAAGGLLFAVFLALALRKLFAGFGQFELLRNTFHHPHIVLTSQEGWRRAAFIGIAGSLTTLFLHSVVDFNMHIQANALLFALLMAAGHNICDEMEPPPDPWPAAGVVRRIVAACLLPVILWQGSAIWTTYSGDRFVRQAERCKKNLDWPAARAAYQRAIHSDPKSSEAWARYASFIYQRALLDVPNKRHFEREFLTISERALELNSLNKLLRVRRGQILDRMEKFEEAEKEYQDAVAFDPTNAYYLNRFGLHYRRWGKKAKARALFEQAAKYPGGHFTADLNLRVLGPIKEPSSPE